jgi:Flp pilus assembly protein TadD
VKTFAYGQRVVLSWHAESDEIRPIPDSAEAALLPEQVKTNEQLYLTGLHLEQYRHATWLATDYYEEALRRDPNDIRCLNALGLWYIRKGRFQKAEEYLRKAYKLSIKRNPNPYDSEPIYNLALALKYQGLSVECRTESVELAAATDGCAEGIAVANSTLYTLNSKLNEAYELFWKATWSKAWADAGYFEAAKISTMQRRYEDALEEIDRCLNNNWHNHKARALKTSILRKMCRIEEALELAKESLQFDLFNYGCRYEQYLMTGDETLMEEMKRMLRKSAQNYDEVALDYAAAGLNDEARDIWKIAIEERATSPMTWYYLFAFCGQQDALAKAEAADSTYCFPNRSEDVIALSLAVAARPEGTLSQSTAIER